MHFRQGQKIQLVVLSDNISIRKTLQGRKHREAQIFEIKTHGIELIPRLSYSDEPQGTWPILNCDLVI